MTENGRSSSTDGARHRLAAPPLAGVFFTREGAHTLIGKIIPYAAPGWSSRSTRKGLFGVRIDRKRKFPGTVFLRALGLETDEAILKKFYSAVPVTYEKGKAVLQIPAEVRRQRRSCVSSTSAASARTGRSSPRSSSRTTCATR